MQKRLGVALFSFVNLERESPVPLFQQLDSQIRQAVLSGRLPSGLRLPSSRVLAIELGVSRTTVVTAFEQLIAEGFLEGRVGAGTFVGADLSAQIMEPPPPLRVTRCAGGTTGACLLAAKSWCSSVVVQRR